jgi:hypothetical protein
MIYTFWHKVLGHPRHDQIKYVNVFPNGILISSKPKNFDYDSYLQSKSTYKVAKTLQDHIKSKFDVIHSNVHGSLSIQSVGR